MFETLTRKEIIEIISHNVLGRLGCHADGKTYVVPISYAYDNNYIYARTFEGMKISMMRKNPDVCFQVDKIKMEGMAEWESVIIWGTFEELTDAKDRKKALKILLSRILPDVASETVMFTPEWPFPTNNLDAIEGIVFRIHIKEMTGRREKLDTEKYRR
ncbi:MAG TPA: pyridoxamine 5'-phosphate oxidase family protein [Hanamia sp.]|nr:pyridoxamine 5'-phosphate oxidase family protein [Hanamia sp.]